MHRWRVEVDLLVRLACMFGDPRWCLKVNLLVGPSSGDSLVLVYVHTCISFPISLSWWWDLNVLLHPFQRVVTAQDGVGSG